MKALVAEAATSQPPARALTFSRVLVGVDGSNESIEAARQAALLAEGTITLLAAYDADSWIAGGTGSRVPEYFDEDIQRMRASEAIDRALEALERPAGVAGRITPGCPWVELVHEIETSRDTLVVVGSHGTGRAHGIVTGSTATELVHKAPCSVLVTRRSARIPRRIVVGVDGSPESSRAYAVARELAARFGSHFRAIVDHAGKAVDMGLVHAITDGDVKETMREPVRALLGASRSVDLVIVGSRGLHGLAALGSVSERVAHQAASSVLIVREAQWREVVAGLEIERG
jgi:nucleotide-binding universal stress UspA family protein